MKIILQTSVAFVLVGAIVGPVSAQVRGDKIPDSYVCVFKNDAVARRNVPMEANRIVQSNGGQIKHIYTVALRGFAANLSSKARQNVEANNPNIAYCEQDQVISTTQFFANAKPSRGGTNTAQPPQFTPWGVARVKGGVGATTKTAWVIDTGIDLKHPDLNVDVARSRSFLGSRTTPQDQDGHGTHVAGTIAAKDNLIGVIGVAPGALVVSVRVLGSRGGTTSGVIAGVDYVAQFGAEGDVANMSLGGGVSSALDNAVIAASNARGVRFVIAAGNSNADANSASPARANGPYIYTVSAFDRLNDKLAAYSNFGNPPIDYAQPGSSIESTWLNGGYNTISGTSMAAPHLAGLLLLGPVNPGGFVSFDKDLTPDIIGVK